MINAVHNSGKNKIFNSEFLNFELIWNKGIAFGLLAFDKAVFYHIITTIIFIVIVILIFLYTKSYGFEKYSYILISFCAAKPAFCLACSDDCLDETSVGST